MRKRSKQGRFRPLPKTQSRSPLGWPAYAILVLATSAAFFAVIWFSGGLSSSETAVETVVETAVQADPYSARFDICAGPVRSNCVVDGDTFWFDAGSGGRKIRIADINTPEITDPGCAYERRLGQRAKMRLLALLNDGRFDLRSIGRDRDQYGRDLRIVTRAGESLGMLLVDEGLAEEWQGYRRNWC